MTERATAVIYGRADSTNNRGGGRVGTSEIYSPVEGVPEVMDSLVVDVDESMLLFVMLRPGTELDEELRARLRQRLREACSPRHVPDEIEVIAEIPRTLSGKKLEVPVKKILLGADPEHVASRDSLANPAALDFFVHRTPVSRSSPR
jgi:acetoacetyl-CoA synthetase